MISAVVPRISQCCAIVNECCALALSPTPCSPFLCRIARGELLTVQIRRDGWASGGWGVPPQTPRDSKRRQEAGPHRGLPRQGGVRSEGHVSVRCVYRPRMQALTTRGKSLAFQHCDMRHPRQGSTSHTETTAPFVATPHSSPHRLTPLEPHPPPQLLRRHASPPHCVWQRSSSATSASSSCCRTV